MLDPLMSLNVLIVDDNEAAADLLQELLQLQEHKALCAYTGRQALEAAAGNAFDIALVDLTLPDMPGTDVARHLRANGGGSPMLVAVSGLGPSDSTREVFDHHLQKPIDFEALDRILAGAA